MNWSSNELDGQMVTHPVAACGASPNNNPEHLRSYANRQATAAIISGWLASRVQFCQISRASQINKRTHCPFASPAGCRREPSPRPPVSHTYSLRRTLTAYLRLRYIIQVLLLLVPEQVVPTSPSKNETPSCVVRRQLLQQRRFRPF